MGIFLLVLFIIAAIAFTFGIAGLIRARKLHKLFGELLEEETHWLVKSKMHPPFRRAEYLLDNYSRIYYQFWKPIGSYIKPVEFYYR